MKRLPLCALCLSAAVGAQAGAVRLGPSPLPGLAVAVPVAAAPRPAAVLGTPALPLPVLLPAAPILPDAPQVPAISERALPLAAAAQTTLSGLGFEKPGMTADAAGAAGEELIERIVGGASRRVEKFEISEPDARPEAEHAWIGEEAAPRVSPPVLSAPPPSSGMTALQRHVAFFDLDGDGVIAYSDTVEGLRRLGVGWLKARVVALGIHVGLGPATSGTWTLNISVADIHRGIHGSDTGVYDVRGRFVPQAFERLFELFDIDGSGSLSSSELDLMIKENNKRRPGAKLAARIEFGLLLSLAADRTVFENGEHVPALSRERLGRFYDGSLFHELAAERRNSR